MTNKVGKNNKSLWEKSMELVVYIAKVSAISLAEKSLGTKPGPVLPPPAAATASSLTIMDATSLAVPSKPSSYMMGLPAAEEVYVIREETNVDGRASDYIRWFHERIRKDSIDASKLSPAIILPPQPRRVNESG